MARSNATQTGNAPAPSCSLNKENRGRWRNKPLPSTNSKFERMDPISEVATTVYSPRCSAAMDRIISTTFPNVAFNRPPIVSPNLEGWGRREPSPIRRCSC